MSGEKWCPKHVEAQKCRRDNDRQSFAGETSPEDVTDLPNEWLKIYPIDFQAVLCWPPSLLPDCAGQTGGLAGGKWGVEAVVVGGAHWCYNVYSVFVKNIWS